MPTNRFGEGVIVNRNHVITTATNVFDVTLTNRLSASVITVRAGAILIPGTSAVLTVSRVYAHEGFNPFRLENNIAVLRVRLRRIKFTAWNIKLERFPFFLKS